MDSTLRSLKIDFKQHYFVIDSSSLSSSLIQFDLQYFNVFVFHLFVVFVHVLIKFWKIYFLPKTENTTNKQPKFSSSFIKLSAFTLKSVTQTYLFSKFENFPKISRSSSAWLTPSFKSVQTYFNAITELTHL